MFSDEMLTKLAMTGPPPSFPATPPPQMGGMFGMGLAPGAPMPQMRPPMPQQSRQDYQMNPPSSIGAALVGG